MMTHQPYVKKVIASGASSHMSK
uniref:Uncharacterized protein n=1 Tax=Rhizophora mucronata TaxID=61149 RepID=A0A2P2PY57_RHIMU